MVLLAMPFLARWGSVAVLACFAAGAAISGLDRIAGNDASEGGVVGWPYDTLSARARSVSLLDGAPSQALPYSIRAVRSDPIDSSVIGQLGFARLMTGDSAGAEAAFRISGGLGWRDKTTQIYWFSKALAQGDVKVAAQRLDALLRQYPLFEQRDSLITNLLAYEEGRQAMADRLAEAPAWAHTFIEQTSRLSTQDLVGRAEVVMRAPSGILGCNDVGGLVDSLLAADLVDEAQGVWRKSCSTDNALLFDGSFRQLDTTVRSRALDWQLSTRGDVDVLADRRDDGSRELSFRVTAPSALAVLRQSVVLSAGHYRLSWSMPGMDEQTIKAFTVSLACAADQSRAVSATRRDGGGGGRYSADFALDDSCKVRTLAFWLEPGPIVRISDVKLFPLR